MSVPSPQPAAPRRAAVAFVFITVALDMLAIGVVIPVLPHLVEAFVGGATDTAARWIGIFGSTFALVQFACAPLLGALSDRFGRRPVILLSNAGLGLDFVLMALAQTLPLLFLGRVLAGVTSASVATANAYIADVTAPEKRAAAFGLLGAAFGLGFVLGPAMGGVLGAVDPRLPFWVAAGLSLCNLAYGLFVLPESLPRERRTPRIDLRRANPFAALGRLREHRSVLGLAFVVFVSNFAHYVLPSTFVLYAGYRYSWSEFEVGLALALVGVCNATVQAVLVRRLVPRFGERRVLLAGFGFGVLGFALMAVAATPAAFLASVPLMALWGLAGPSTQSLITRRVGAGEQGRVQGAVSALSSLAGIVAPTLFAQTFAAFVGPRALLVFPGAAFALASAVLALAFALAWRVARPVPDAA